MDTNHTFDVIVIGAGSLGIPIALNCAKARLKTLVIDQNPSISQGDNKHAIGGIRSTHTQKSKIWLCQRSIEIFSTWEQTYGDNIDWYQGGYCYVAYTPDHERMFQNNLKLQHSFGLEIDYVDAERIQQLVPGISAEGLLGGTFSPKDGNASPLLAANAFYHRAQQYGAQFHCNETVTGISVKNEEIHGVQTSKHEYECRYLINAAGAHAAHIGKMVGIDIPVTPTSHEAAITEPIAHFLDPMVVDVRGGKDLAFTDSSNYYFYQNKEGQIVFCITPSPPIYGFNREETSFYLPQIAKRMVQLVPRLAHLRVRRTWRGLYPDTPDGAPIIGSIKAIAGFINVAGPCGQGYMLGPGVGELVPRIIQDTLTSQDREILQELSLYRNFGTVEKLK